MITDDATWESFWIRLLREYEQVCRELDRRADPPPDDPEPTT